MNYKELFIDKDDVLLIRKELVRVLGDLNEAVILNQLNYWIEINKKAEKNFYDNRYWVFNTYQTWKETDFDFWSTDTIRRTLTRLENKGIVLTANYNKMKIDKTKWYTIDYEKLQNLIDEYEKKQNAIKETADCGHDMANCTDGNGNVSKAIPENTPKNTHKDYIPEINKEDKTLSNDNGEVKTSFSENRKKMYVSKTSLEKYFGKKAEEQDMMKRLADICILNYDEGTAKEIFETIDYYIRRYTEKTGLIHPILKDETLIRMTEKMDCFYDSKYSHFERLIGQDHAFIKMVDMFFDGDFGSNNGYETNYHLPAFMSDEVLNRLGQRLFELGEVE